MGGYVCGMVGTWTGGGKGCVGGEEGVRHSFRKGSSSWIESLKTGGEKEVIMEFFVRV